MNFDALLPNLVTLGTTWGARIVGVLLALWIASIVGRWLSNGLARRLQAREFDATLTRFFANVVRYAILVGAVIGCLGVFGFQTATFAAVIAAMGLAIGFALQGTLSNFAAGLMLMVFRPFKVGDLVKVGGEFGVVCAIDLFTTDLDTLDNRRIVVPNGEIFGKTIENLTHHPTRRVDITVGASYSADTDATRAALDQCVEQIEGVVADPPHQIFLKELGASSVDWQVRVWCKTEDYWDVHQATIRAAKKALEGANINIPFPQLDVHFDENAVKTLSRR